MTNLMEIRYINNACQLLTCGSTTILLDPWLQDGAYYGSWGMENELGMQIDQLKPDYIWLSHVHPDHYDPRSLHAMKPREILIGTFRPPILSKVMQREGFSPVTLENDKWHSFGDFDIAIMNLDEIDSIALFRSDGKVVAFIADTILNDDLRARIFTLTTQIDLAYIPYAGANSWPQCFTITPEEKSIAQCEKRLRFLNKAYKNFIDLGMPPLVLYAGEYRLIGRLEHLNDERGVVTRTQALSALAHMGARVLDVETGGVVGFSEGSATVLVKGQSIKRRSVATAYDYDHIACSGRDELMQAITGSARTMMTQYEKCNDKQLDDWQLVIHVSDYNLRYYLSFGERASVPDIGDKYLEVTASSNLIIAVANEMVHWKNLDIGSHLIFKRRPDVYIKQMHQMLCYFHL